MVIGIVILYKQYYISKMVDILDDTTKFEILGSVKNVIKVSPMNNAYNMNYLDSTNNIWFPKRSMREYARSAFRDHGFMDSPKFNNKTFHSDQFNQWLTLLSTTLLSD